MSSAHLVLFVFTLFIQNSQPARPDCKEWHECQQMALDAAARQDYETFHDLAWRAVQTGPKNDPDLMYLLARAQSLSGRPSDALVMLQRLAQMGRKTDAATNEDFRRVRALPGWAEMEGTTAAATAAGAAPARSPSTVKETAAASSRDVDTGKPREDTKPSPPAAPASNAAPPAADSAVAPKRADARTAASPLAVESLRFTATASTPAGLAYDAVSRRFIVADRDARKLTVVDEFSQHVANLASAQSAGFGNIAALEIDTRQGNLWVVSTDTASTNDPPPQPAGQSLHTTLHKLQLISGRVLQSFVLPDRLGAATFADVAVTPDSTVLALDDSGQRIIRLRARSTELEVAATLKDRPLTIAPASDARAYVATADGIVIVDLGSRAMTKLKAASGVNLARVSRLRWHKGSLVGIQQNDGAYQAVRFTLDPSGSRATRQQILDASLPTIEPTAAAVAGGVLYYLATGNGSEMVIRKITLP